MAKRGRKTQPPLSKAEMKQKRYLTLSEFARYTGKTPSALVKSKLWREKSKIYPEYIKDGKLFQNLGQLRLIDIESLEKVTILV